MKIYEALKIFGISQEDQFDSSNLKKLYLELCKKWHPDINENGEEMMKLINNAWEVIKSYSEKGFDSAFKSAENKSNGFNWDWWKSQTFDGFVENLDHALSFIKQFNVNVELCGVWIWVSGNTKAIKDDIKEWNRKQEEGMGKWKWSRDKQEWYFCNPANKSRKFGKDRKAWDKSQIRNHYGSKFYRQEEKYQQIA